jgi:phage gp29-like protein
MVKRHIVRFYAIFLEKAAGPIPVAKYEKSVPNARVQEVHNAIKNFQAKTAITLPKDFDIEFLEAKGNGEAYVKGINLFNMFIGRALTIPDLLGFQGG